MARMTYAQAVGKTVGYYIHKLLAPLASGKNPDGTDYSLPVEITNVDGSVTLSVDEVDWIKVAQLSAATAAVDNATTTDAIPVPSDAKSAFIELPAYSGTPDVTVQGSVDATNFADLWEWAAGAPVQVKLSASAGGIVLGPILVTGLAAIKLVTSTAQTGTYRVGFR